MEINTGDYKVMQQDDMKCVWMTSGIISYKLCSLNFFCENCAFDRVMHNETALNIQKYEMYEAETHEVSSADSSTRRLDGSLFYHKNHCWVKVVKPDEVVIGINGILAKIIYGIKTVVLPKVGDQVARDLIFAHIMQQKHIIPLIMPVSGVITAVNTVFDKRPNLLRTEFSQKGWLVTVKADNLENDLRTLSFGSRAMEWYQAKERIISEKIQILYNEGRENIGPTMHDGGELAPNAAGLLSLDQYDRVLDELY